MIDEDPLRERAANQHGLVTVGQMRGLGYSARQRHDLIDGRRWERVTPRVIRLIGTPSTVGQRATAAVLDSGSGAALCGTSAGAWWGIPGLTVEPFEVTRDRGHSGKPQRGDRRHDPCLLPAHHIRVLEDVPVVTPARALFDIAGTKRRGAELPSWVERMARLTDAAWSLGLVSGTTLSDMLDDMAQRGRPGIRTMRQVLADRPRGYQPPASGLESRFMQILASAGLPEMQRQVDTGSESGWIGRVDFRDPHLQLIVEIQSERFHTSLTDRSDDTARLAKLRAAGFKVLEITDQDVWLRRAEVIRRVSEVRRSLLRACAHLVSTPRPRTRRRSVREPAHFFDQFAGVRSQPRRATARSTMSAMIRESSKSFGV